MNIKLIAIGSRLMGDDGVGIHVAENIRQSLEATGIEVIIGETDFQYCLSHIEQEDYLIIIDATWFGIDIGSVTVKHLIDIYKLNCSQSLFSLHGYSLIRALESYYKDIDGFIVGIEGGKFDFSLELSSDLEKQLDNICDKVKKEIYAYIKEK